jgi:site-specific DNA-methyltransferase (adenine-specific)
MINLYNGDCLDLLRDIPDGSVDAVICDPPYGTTACKWDSVIPFEPMWEQLKRVTKKNGAIVLFGQEPFSSMLRVSNIEWFKYDYYWRKNKPSGFTNARLKPLKDIEVISVFSEGNTANGSKNNMPYYPQGVGEGKLRVRPNAYIKSSGVSPDRKSRNPVEMGKGSGYPRQVLEGYKHHANTQLHETQKPVALMEHLIKTYTIEGETVLDFTMGSGTTGVACRNLGRSFIGIELDAKYFAVASKRIDDIDGLGPLNPEFFE